MAGALAIGFVLFASFIVYERRARTPMLPLELFSRRNFTVANAQTFAMYGGIALWGFFATIYLQQVAGYSALKAGATGLIPTIVMFLLSRRMGKLADRYGPRFFLTVGPFTVALGFLLMVRFGTSVSIVTDVLPALLVFSLGLSLTVAPLTATVLGDVEESEAGIASAVNNAIARTAGLIAVAAVGAVVSAHYAALLDQGLGNRLPPGSQAAVTEAKRRTFGVIKPGAVPLSQRAFAAHVAASSSEDAFHLAVEIGAGLLLVCRVRRIRAAHGAPDRCRGPGLRGRAARWSTPGGRRLRAGGGGRIRGGLVPARSEAETRLGLARDQVEVLVVLVNEVAHERAVGQHPQAPLASVIERELDQP